jgi:glycosyltransferase involved in cell wall biosynthesis
MWPLFEKAGVPLVDYEIGSKFNLIAIRKLRTSALFHRADLIHTQGPASLDALAERAAAAAGIPFVMTRPVMLEDEIGLSRWRGTVHEWVDSQTRKRATRIVAICKAGRAHLEEVARVNPGKIRLVYNGVDLSRFAIPFTKKDPGKCAEGPFTVGMVAQLTSVKGWPDFIAVIGLLQLYHSGTRALIVGDGPLRSILEKMVQEKGLSGIIRFVGHQEDVPRWLREMNLFLFTSHLEGLSVAILEALGCGLPIVATDTGGIHEQVVDGMNGYILPVGDIDGLANRCAQLLSSPESMADFGRASRERAERFFSDDAMVHGYAECYREVATPGQGKPPGRKR